MEYPSNDIRNIAFEAINSRFSRGKYLGVEVTIDMTNGYINGPHLVSQVLTKTGKPKQFSHCKETKQYTEMIEYLATIGLTMVDLVKEVTDAPNGLRGTYIHPRLVPHVAQWASPMFADKVALILTDRVIADAIASKDIQLKSANEKIDGLLAEMREQRKIMTGLLSNSVKANEDAEQMADALD
jgi:KilA-N domain